MRVTYFAAALSLTCSTLLLGQDTAANKGKALFSKYGCYECHGTQGQGTTAGARLAPKPIALAALIAYVRQPKGQMPPYTAKVVSDADLADIRAYLASIPDPPPAKNIPLLNQ
ncbi:MAG: cytochrome c [Acidobacteriia bacterium]|nr:cytochrome c [Terriglobia bacterium]